VDDKVAISVWIDERSWVRGVSRSMDLRAYLRGWEGLDGDNDGDGCGSSDHDDVGGEVTGVGVGWSGNMSSQLLLAEDEDEDERDVSDGGWERVRLE